MGYPPDTIEGVRQFCEDEGMPCSCLDLLEWHKLELERAVRSTQDLLLHSVPRTREVAEQLEINRSALVALNSDDPGPVLTGGGA